MTDSRSRRSMWRRWVAVPAAVLVLAGAVPSGAATVQGAVPRAHCGAGSLPETGLQGQVPKADRDSGRSRLGYRCNLRLVGQQQGQGSSYVSASYGHCAYLPQAFPSSLASQHPGVQVIDVKDPRHPRLVRHLTSPAFLGDTWESLKLSRTGLLAGVFVGPIEGTAFLDLYDVGKDCTNPTLLNSVSSTQLSIPANALGHEGAFSPDGRTYWATGGAPGVITAIDVSDPHLPRVLYTGFMGVVNHGLSLSGDGRTLYLSTIYPEGLAVYDVSSIQDRALVPSPQALGTLTWTDGANGQHSIPVTWHGHRYLIFVDEQGEGGVRILDIQDLKAMKVLTHLRLEVQLPTAADAQKNDDPSSPLFVYQAHYCAVDRVTDPTALACGEFESGVRVFDIRDPRRPREIAYYNPDAQEGKAAQLPGSQHAQGDVGGEPGGQLAALGADWCSSPPRFVGRDQLWVACQDNGFLALQFTNRVFPLGP